MLNFMKIPYCSKD